MRFKQLQEWLRWQETLHPVEIDLGLERITQVLAQAKLSTQFNCPLISVAGTNGKGSVVAMLEAIAIEADLNVASYTSPHLIQYNERIKYNGDTISDSDLCLIFEQIDQTRADVPLSYFEFGTLAAIYYFFQQKPDLIIMEIGLGGRLDAVNVMQNDISIITSIAIDHESWLGHNREQIGFEKAGIFKKNTAVICGESNPPKSLIKQAKQQQCRLYQLGKDYQVASAQAVDSWTYCSNIKLSGQSQTTFVNPKLKGEFQKRNAATAIMALQALEKRLALFKHDANREKLSQKTINRAFKQLHLNGRFSQINNKPDVFVDVAHNPHAATALADILKQTADNSQVKTWAIVAMLADKDVENVINNTMVAIDYWCFAGLENISRGLSACALFEKLPNTLFDIKSDNNDETKIELTQKLQDELVKNQCTIVTQKIYLAQDVKKACELVLDKMQPDDHLIIFGSFYTVASAIEFFKMGEE